MAKQVIRVAGGAIAEVFGDYRALLRHHSEHHAPCDWQDVTLATAEALGHSMRPGEGLDPRWEQCSVCRMSRNGIEANQYQCPGAMQRDIEGQPGQHIERALAWAWDDEMSRGAVTLDGLIVRMRGFQGGPHDTCIVDGPHTHIPVDRT